MTREFYRPLVQAITYLILILLVKLTATVTLRDIGTAYSVMQIVLSVAVVIVLLQFRSEFNRQLANSYPGYPEAQSFITGIVLLLAILTLYGTFIPYSDILPYGSYNVLFFIFSLVPVYLLWNILNRNAEKLAELLIVISPRKITCSCGWDNPASAKFCNRCGSHL